MGNIWANSSFREKAQEFTWEQMEYNLTEHKVQLTERFTVHIVAKKGGLDGTPWCFD